jgi:hypothetical protein
MVRGFLDHDDRSVSHDVQVVPRIHDFDAAVLLDSQQVIVAGDDIVNAGGKGAFQIFVVVGVSANAGYPMLGKDNDHSSARFNVLYYVVKASFAKFKLGHPQHISNFVNNVAGNEQRIQHLSVPIGNQTRLPAPNKRRNENIRI